MRVVHCKREPYDVYIGRPSRWGNPWSHIEGKGDFVVAAREDAIREYETLMRGFSDEELLEVLRPLVGKVLGCWCAPKACHGDVLIALCKEKGLIE